MVELELRVYKRDCGPKGSGGHPKGGCANVGDTQAMKTDSNGTVTRELTLYEFKQEYSRNGKAWTKTSYSITLSGSIPSKEVGFSSYSYQIWKKDTFNLFGKKGTFSPIRQKTVTAPFLSINNLEKAKARFAKLDGKTFEIKVHPSLLH